jgi:hypothetical protein
MARRDDRERLWYGNSKSIGSGRVIRGSPNPTIQLLSVSRYTYLWFEPNTTQYEMVHRMLIAFLQDKS